MSVSAVCGKGDIFNMLRLMFPLVMFSAKNKGSFHMIIQKSMPHIHFRDIMVIQKNSLWLSCFSGLLVVMFNLEGLFCMYVKIVLNGCNVFEPGKPFDSLGILHIGCHCTNGPHSSPWL